MQPQDLGRVMACVTAQVACVAAQASWVHAAALAHGETVAQVQSNYWQHDGSGWVHPVTGDRWSGQLCTDVPVGQGEYVFADTQLRVTARLGSESSSLGFSGEMCSMTWPNGSSYTGALVESAFHGHGTFKWANGDVYHGEWKRALKHGTGHFILHQGPLLNLPAGERALSASYSGSWADDVMHGQGCIEFFGCANGSKGSEDLRRRFQGLFNIGFPTQGSLQTGQEFFGKVQFDGNTPAGGFAVWYWSGDALSESRGTSLVDVHRGGEEFQAVLTKFSDSASMSNLEIKSIQRVQNEERRLMYDLQRRALEKKVTAPPRSMRWNPLTMERWAFHAPGCGQVRPCEDGPGAALPWECIVEEGYHATLAGSENGRTYGAGIYFAKDAAQSDRYAQKAARTAARMQGHASGHESEKVCRIFLTRIVTGMYTVGQHGMNQPPIDAAGAKGEHFHSLVDKLHNPTIFVINDNTRAYPAYLVTYESSPRSSGWRLKTAAQKNLALFGVPAGAHHAGNAMSCAKAPYHNRGRMMQPSPMLNQPGLAASGCSHGSGSTYGVDSAGRSIYTPNRSIFTSNLGSLMPAPAVAATGKAHGDKRKREGGVAHGGGGGTSTPPAPFKALHPCVDDNDRLADNMALMSTSEAREELRRRKRAGGSGDGEGVSGKSSGNGVASAASKPSASLKEPQSYVDDNDRLADNLALMFAREASEEKRQEKHDALRLLSASPC